MNDRPNSPEGFADDVARSSAHLYSNIVEWYVDRFFDDLDDSDWLSLFASELAPSGLVLDVGAGPGNFARFIAGLGHKTISTDIATEMVRASHELVPECPALVSDMRNLPFCDKAFDGILCAYSLMHIPGSATRAVVEGFVRSMRDGGVLQLMIKTGDGSYQFQSGLVDSGRGFVQLWGANEFVQLVEQAGCTVVEVQEKPPTSPYEFEHPKLMVLARREPARLGRIPSRQER